MNPGRSGNSLRVVPSWVPVWAGENMTKTKWSTAARLACVGVGLVGLSIGVARASVPPDDEALVYAGVLEQQNGTPLSGAQSIRVEIYDGIAATSPLCWGEDQRTPVTSGRFRMRLPSCTPSIRSAADTYVEVKVNGITVGERTRIRAVPYAVEATRSSSATGALGDLLASLVPPKTIVSAYLSQRDVTDNFTPEGLGKVPGPYAGWAICNGSNGTPNLAGRFVRGSAAGAGATGGSDTIAAHTHPIDHDHGAFNSAAESGHTHSIPDHGHVLPMGWDTNNFFYGVEAGGGPLYGSAVTTVTRYTPGLGLSGAANGISRLAFTAQGGAGTTGGSSGHVHSVDPPGFSGASGPAGAGDNRPAFTELVALMRL